MCRTKVSFVRAFICFTFPFNRSSPKGADHYAAMPKRGSMWRARAHASMVSVNKNRLLVSWGSRLTDSFEHEHARGQHCPWARCSRQQASMPTGVKGFCSRHFSCAVASPPYDYYVDRCDEQLLRLLPTVKRKNSLWYFTAFCVMGVWLIDRDYGINGTGERLLAPLRTFVKTSLQIFAEEDDWMEDLRSLLECEEVSVKGTAAPGWAVGIYRCVVHARRGPVKADAPGKVRPAHLVCRFSFSRIMSCP